MSEKENKNSPADDDHARELKDLKAENRRLKEESGSLRGNLTKVQNKNAKLEAKLAQKTAPKEKESPATPTSSTINSASVSSAGSSTTPAVSPKEPEPKEHVLEWQPPFCAECGDKNLNFKDEVRCVNCNAPLGSENYAKHKMKVCPLCGEAKGFRAAPGYEPQHGNCTGPECKLIQPLAAR